MEVKKVNINEKFDLFTNHWSPKIVGELNEQLVKIVKVKGEFVMHKHDNEDELFMVMEGRLFIELKEKTLELETGEFVIIPKGVEHKPFAPEEVKVLMFEPKTTLNTGDAESDFKVEDLEVL